MSLWNCSKRHISYLYSTLLILIFFLLALTSSALAFDTANDFERKISSEEPAYKNTGSLSLCFPDGQVMAPWEYLDFNNTYIPPVLNKDTVYQSQQSNTSNPTAGIIASSTVRAAVYMQLIKSGASIFVILALGAEYLVMIDACSNSYILAPHEYVNRDLLNNWSAENYKQYDRSCANPQYKAGTSTDPYDPSTQVKGYFTQSEIPFYYSCDPTYDPTTGNTVTGDQIGQVWGYDGAASDYCTNGLTKRYQDQLKVKVGQVRVEHSGRGLWNKHSRCTTHDGVDLKAGEAKWLGPHYMYAYYRFNRSIGRIQICVSSVYTLFPIRIGCSYVPPPKEDKFHDEILEQYVSGTRCGYFLGSRDDLNNLGVSLHFRTINDISSNGPIKEFLKSDFHITSTVVGCIKDLLIKVLVKPTSSGDQAGFFEIVQNRFFGIVTIVLGLYISLIGIKIMISSHPPGRGEISMFLLKMALVIYFTMPSTQNPWYQNDSQGTKGLFPSLIFAADEIAQFFMEAQNENDPLSLCYYEYLEEPLLTEREIEPLAPGDKSTLGYNGKVKLTVWDLVDCKLINYLNLGSRKYSSSGIIGFWLVAAFLGAGSGFIVAIASFVYLFMLLLVIFRFTHIFILSSFVIAVLVLVSPLIICFSLFEATKGIFQQWMKLLLAYILYPALLFAFVALMLMTFDSVFFGDLADRIKKGGKSSIVEYCRDVDSVFCVTTVIMNGDNTSNLTTQFTEQKDLGMTGNWTVISGSVLGKYMLCIPKLALFAVLFYFLMSSITQFIAVLVGAQDMGGMALGSVNAVSAMKMAGGAVAGAGKLGLSAIKSMGNPAGGQQGKNKDD
ncbi:hypothetical protein EDM53_04355 [Rickettsiales endosymbiont of Peranema trichophorum]|uniref:type IV secretion system protein n=1 Tax=Rickettsiales endosymbiont of Peranema trichophorum TaxID=2486577 RepID=UPI001023E9DB|nr:type IV secretion system protein [Rickettsiales endosymbiont of Peranema trichophorum]RZI46017.1 hypothetical protein EDM53_04355 [Rickettsiales endosymbiont of Peranema trichophorum]